MFLRMLETGIAYQKTGVVNWDPVDKTVLANEQVIDGRGWRTGALVERREIPMYYLKITAYAEDLLESLKACRAGRSACARCRPIGSARARACGSDFRTRSTASEGVLHAFTTRADTLMGVTFCAVAAEHPLAMHAARKIRRWRHSSRSASAVPAVEAELATQEKKGMATGLRVRHPLTGEPCRSGWATTSS